MPEKPEVLTVVKSLKPRIIGKVITDCNVYWDNIIAYPTTMEFKKNVVLQKINDIFTRGKWIVISLDRDYLLIHLRMEGKFFFRNVGEKIEKHEHVEFILDNKVSFRFHDVRKFGKMYLLDKNSAYNVKPLVDIGLEYNDPKLTKKYLYDKIHNKRLPIKTTLLDQGIIAGIGNIYDDEILYMSRISPLRKSCDITLDECESIIKNTQIILDKAIKFGGTTIKSFTSSEGVHGLFQHELLVHGKKNGFCPSCGSKLEFEKIGGRGTYFCSNCQK